MTDKAEDVIARLERLMTLNTNSASQTRDDALTLIAAQAAEIAALKTSRASIDQMRERNAALEAELDKVAKIVDVFKKIAGRV